jgi:hypothetical protein
MSQQWEHASYEIWNEIDPSRFLKTVWRADFDRSVRSPEIEAVLDKIAAQGWEIFSVTSIAPDRYKVFARRPFSGA